MGKTWPWLWPFRCSQAREGSGFNASTLGLAPCQRGKGRGRGTSFQLGPVKIGLFVLHGTRVQLEWLEVATVWHLGDTGCLDCLEDAIQSVAWTRADLGCRTSPPQSIPSAFQKASFQTPQNDLSYEKGFSSFQAVFFPRILFSQCVCRCV